MSFRHRLTLFFVFIVVVPMISVTLVVFRLIADSESGKADAALAATAGVAVQIYRHDASGPASIAALRLVSSDRPLVRALETGDRAAAQLAARRLLARHIVRIQITRGSTVLANAGSASAIAPIARELIDRRRKSLGRLQLSTQEASGYAAVVHRETGADVVVRSGPTDLARTLAPTPASLPSNGDARVSGHAYRVFSFGGPGYNGRRLSVFVLANRAAFASGLTRNRILAGVILGGFFVIALAFALLVSRTLQQQIASFLEAARRLGEGDFSARVPVVGRDEFAALGDEFNKMSGQLEARLAQVREQQARLEQSLQRIGEAFASNLDRDALLKIALRTAVEGVGAGGGRFTARAEDGGTLEERARVGRVGRFADALRAVETDVLESGKPGEATSGSAHALAHPLYEGESQRELFGLISVARNDRHFSTGERDLFNYLVRQGAVSIENVGLHETVQRQAVTDELTGLYNQRRFREALDNEVERSRRFDQQLGLVMLDIDNFKRVNDVHGHQQGDLVLRAVARVLRDCSREIDAPARYGGEELAVVLPQTDLDGAYNLGERIRTGIEQLELPLVNGDGAISVTASLGVAALPVSASDTSGLIAAADAALYQAKRAGKNMTVRAK